MRYPVFKPYVAGMIACSALASGFSGCESPQKAHIRARIENSLAWYRGSVKDPVDRIYFPIMLKAVQTTSVAPGMAPVLPIALLESRNSQRYIWAWWIEDQPSVRAIRLQAGTKEWELPIPQDQIEANERSKNEWVTFTACIKLTKDSEVDQLLRTSSDPVLVRVICSKVGASALVPLTRVNADSPATSQAMPPSSQYAPLGG